MKTRTFITGAASLTAALLVSNLAKADEVFVCEHQFGTHVITIPSDNVNIANEV